MGEFAGGFEDEALGFAERLDLGEDGEGEGGGLAGTGLGGPDHVPACQDHGDGLGLDWGGGFVAAGGDCLKDGRREAQLVKTHAGVLVEGWGVSVKAIAGRCASGIGNRAGLVHGLAMEFAERWSGSAPWVTDEPDGAMAKWAKREKALAGQVLFATSGSLGVPKRVALSKLALEVSARRVNEHLGVDRKSVWGLALPTWHVGGFGVMLRAWLAGSKFVRREGKWEVGSFAKWLVETKATHVSLVPTQVHDLVAAGVRAPTGVRVILVGAGRLGTRLGTQARALGWPVVATYGMTEAASQVATGRLDSLGEPYRPAPLRVLPHWQVCVGEGGRLWLRGESLFSGTVEGAEGQWTWNAREGEWWATNDCAEATSDGWLSPLGRLDAMVKIMGELVDPGAVEEQLADIGGPALARRLAVVAVPDARAGHRLVVVVEESVGKGEMARVLDTYHRSARGFARLSGPVRVPELPRSPMGKPLRGEIATKVGGGAFRD